VIAQDNTHTEKTNHLFLPQGCYPGYSCNKWLIWYDCLAWKYYVQKKF